MADLTIKEVAARLSRAPSSVREWAAAGLFPGAVKHGRDWAIPPQALAGFSPPKRGPKFRTTTKGASR